MSPEEPAQAKRWMDAVADFLGQGKFLVDPRGKSILIFRGSEPDRVISLQATEQGPRIRIKMRDSLTIEMPVQNCEFQKEGLIVISPEGGRVEISSGW